MAARLNRMHSNQVLERIQLSNLVTRVQKHALRQLKNPNDGTEISMTDGELRAALFLIERKLARAEAPKKLEVSGTVTLAELVTGHVVQDERSAGDRAH